MRTNSVAIVAASAVGDRFEILETKGCEIENDERDSTDANIVRAIRGLLRTMASRERRCVLVAAGPDVISRTFRIPPGMRPSEAERAASLEADQLVTWPASERLVALDRIPGVAEEALLSIARTSVIERLVNIARSSGLRPVAVDVLACAWRRAAADFDAVLDCSTDRASLHVFGGACGISQYFAPRLVDERLAVATRSALGEARRDGLADVQRLAIFASALRFEILHKALSGDGYQVSPLAIGSIEMPAWALAYGLASWSVAALGLRTA